MPPGPTVESERRRRKAALVAFVAVQAFAAAFFVLDATADLSGSVVDIHTVIEAIIAIGLVGGSLFGVSELRQSHRLIASQETALATASGALAEVIDRQFEAWRLTPAERDVGLLALKGFDIAEIAELRNAAQGTVRAQMTAIYSKSGLSGRAQFAAFFVEDLMNGGVRAVTGPQRISNDAA
ncbi:MAG: response regulator transcription factor [Rhodobacteraceae bacterium]|nr:response regulator transcription factor [Paracoccaceae bacterium]